MTVKHRIKKKLLSLRCTLARNIKLFQTKNDNFLLSLKNKHKGEKCVILAMGPSLKQEDLKRFKGFKTLACNKIYLAMENTNFVPDYYFVVDELVAKNNKQEILKRIPDSVCRIYSKLCFKILRGNSNYFIGHKPFSFDEPSFKDDLLEGLYIGGYTVIFPMIQFAYYMGFSEIYIVGLDFSFDIPKNSQTNEKSKSGDVLVSQGEINHFHKDYRKPGETWTVPKMEEQKIAFDYINQASQNTNVKIFNASRKTKLDFIKKVDFEEVFSEES
ncbi:MAG: 6-hydroxymethylpterin diphosphokinase MptE-like protein [Bacteroidota bacterium]